MFFLVSTRLVLFLLVLVLILLVPTALCQNITEHVTAYGVVEQIDYVLAGDYVGADGIVYEMSYVYHSDHVGAHGRVVQRWLNVTLNFTEIESPLLIDGVLYVLPEPYCTRATIRLWSWYGRAVTIEMYEPSLGRYRAELERDLLIAITRGEVRSPEIKSRWDYRTEELAVDLVLCSRWFLDTDSLLMMNFTDYEGNRVNVSIPIHYVGWTYLVDVNVSKPSRVGEKIVVRGKVVFILPRVKVPAANEYVTVLLENATTGTVLYQVKTRTGVDGSFEVSIPVTSPGDYIVFIYSEHSMNTSTVYFSIGKAAPAPAPKIPIMYFALAGAGIILVLTAIAAITARKRRRAEIAEAVFT